LKIALDSNGPFISLSVMNQSKDRKVSEESPILLIGSNILNKESG